MTEYIIHIDIDAFFAQVEEVLNPSVAGKPLGVQQNYEVASVNYAAREHGLFNRITVSEAKRLCPQIVLVQGDNSVDGMQRYRRASQHVLRVIMQELSPLIWGATSKGEHTWEGQRIENASFDDFYLVFDDRMAQEWLQIRKQRACSSQAALYEAAWSWCEHCRSCIARETKLKCSAGLGPTKLLSALATKVRKPNGQFGVKFGDEASFIAEVKLTALKGAGLRGVPVELRAELEASHGKSVCLADLKKGLDNASSDAWSSREATKVLWKIMSAGDDGSQVPPFELPKSVSMELNIRPSNFEPCTSVDAVCTGFLELADVLLRRAFEDETTYGVRLCSGIVARWKLFGNHSKDARQKGGSWPGSNPSLRSVSSASLGAAASNLFRTSLAKGEQISISRIGLVIQFKSAASTKCRLGKLARPLAQPTIFDSFKKQRSAAIVIEDD